MPEVVVTSLSEERWSAGPIVLDFLDMNLELLGRVVHGIGLSDSSFALPGDVSSCRVWVRNPWGKDRERVLSNFDSESLIVRVDDLVRERSLALNPSTSMPEGFWIRYWFQETSCPWTEAALPVDPVISSSHCELKLSSYDRKVCVAFGGNETATKCVIVPPGFDGSVWLTPHDADPSKPWRTVLSARTIGMQREVNALCGYLRHARAEYALCVSQALLKADISSGRLSHPLSLCVALASDIQFLSSVEKQYLSFDALKDGGNGDADRLTVRGWYLLHQDSAGEEMYEECRNCLLAAASTGLPAYTRIFRLLVEGLAVFESQDAGDRTVKAAHQYLLAFAKGMDWASPYTQFRGLGPTEPTVDYDSLMMSPGTSLAVMPRKERGWKENVVIGLGRRKSAVARVRIRAGTGAIVINGKPHYEYFSNSGQIVELTEPLRVASLCDEVDVWVRVNGGGVSGQARAISLGIARAVQTGDNELGRIMRQNGLLTRDSRRVERKKPGCRKARRKKQFSKR